MRRTIILWTTLLVSFALSAWASSSQAETLAPIQVGVFCGNGASASSVQNALEALRIDLSIRAVKISAADIAAGGLEGLDVIVFPGGGGGRQRTDLGDEGAARVRSFVLEKGKGAVGLCAGAYLLSDTPDYACLHLCPLKAIDREHDERGHGFITFKPTAAGLEFFPELRGWGDGHAYYYEGPILVPAEDGPTSCTVLATMESDVHLENDAPAGMTPGRPLFARAETGKGRVFLSAGHPEATPGLRWMVARAVRWVARREPVPYTAAVVRPGLRGQEGLFDKALRDEEASHFQTLMYGESPAKMAALGRLAAMGSWDGPLWIRGFVRSSDAQVRVCAARTLVEMEWTAGIPDLEAAVRTESDPGIRADLALCLARLNAMAPAAAVRGGEGGRREVAVTVDDLPLVNAGTDDPAARTAMVRKLAGAFQSDHIPVTAFVVGRNTRSPGAEDLLKVWLEAGVELGNHTGTHTSLHQMGLESYEADIMAEDAPLRALLASKGQVPRYFRHPMLQTGRSQAIKRDLTAFLADHGYAVAPVTIDNSEWIFAKAYANALERENRAGALERGDKAEAARVKAAYIPYMESKFDYWERQSKQLLGYEVKQILLFHSNALNADAAEDLVAMIKRRGYTFITLDQALKDPAYALPDGYEGGAGISWLHRWAMALGGKAAILPGETACPEWVMRAAGVDSE
jgi:peptidoglycan/xylan/chitin deacetylase (PgdA/CDA1 family)/glutamine amidotransferase-like uncharacterized protein